MENCLVTKLKGTVSGSFLPVFGDWFVQGNGTEDLAITIGPAANKSIVMTDSDGNTQTIQANTQVQIAKNKKYNFSKASDIYYLEFAENTMPNFNLIGVGAPATLITIGKVKVAALPRIENTSISISYINPLEGMAAFVQWAKDYVGGENGCTLLFCPELSITDIAQFGKGGCSYFCITGSDVTGTVESFVAIRRSLGQSEGIVTWRYMNDTSITFNGGAISGAQDTFNRLSWTADTITLDGVTIDA